MRVLFLDFDGVLNSHDWWTRRGARTTQTVDEWEFDPSAIALLNQAIRDDDVQSDVRVVVSSSWRYGRTVENLRDLLEKVGVAAQVIDKTVDYIDHDTLAALTALHGVRHAERGAEIAEWLSRHTDTVETYAIVDDDSDAGVGHDGHFVKTKFANGLVEAHVRRLRSILFPIATNGAAR